MKIALISVAPPYRGGISKHTSILVKKLSKAHSIDLINYKKWWIGDIENQRISEIEYRAGLIKEHFEVDVDPVPYFKPFLFYDIGMIGNNYDGNNIYHSAGIGINIYGLQFILASRLDRDTDNWSVLFDFAGFFGRENYLPK